MEILNNLDNFNVKKLNTNEAAKINGGGPLSWAAKQLVKYVVKEAIEHWDDIKRGYNEEENSEC